MYSKIIGSLLALALAIGLISCYEEKDVLDLESQNSDLSVTVIEGDTDFRFTQQNDTIGLIAEGPEERRAREFDLVVVAEVSSPEIDRRTLMANSIDIRNSSILVSYNLRGDDYGGAVDVLKIKGDTLSLKSQLIVQNGDVNAAYFGRRAVYFVGARSGLSDSTAYVYKIPIRQSIFQTDRARHSWLGGHAATSFLRAGQHVYITTGNDETLGGGLYRMLDNDFTLHSYTALRDARWVDAGENRVYVQQGTPGALSVLDVDTESMQSFSFQGLSIPESKSSFDISGNLVFLASGYQGVQILNRHTGEKVGEIPLPEGSSSDLVTNSVSVQGGRIFVSNGESVLVAKFNRASESDPAPSVYGTLNLGEHQSINHVRFRGNRLVIAAGLGGTKIVKLSRRRQN